MSKKIVIYINDPIDAQYQVECALTNRLYALCNELTELIGKKDSQKVSEICDTIKNLITYKIKLEKDDE